MTMRKILAVLTAAAALVAGLFLTGNAASATSPQPAFAAQARDAGLNSSEAAQLQRKVDAALAANPGARQESANKLSIPGGTLTISGPGAFNALLACSAGHLCITDGSGNNFDYYTCGSYPFSGTGDGTFNNNQTTGTKARFYNFDGNERWSNVAKATGTASWTPVYTISPC
ncbi:hypothetical protein [Kitasatospora sp. NPDC088351]|uniref:hypothetical protein n=1 Tax=Kitasatospora sp. NPDC088351 TaxID=3155180 RepID=UPI0034273F6D